MRKYSDYQKDNKSNIPLTEEEFKNVKWTNYRIVVPSEADKEELKEAFKMIHNEGFDSDIIVLNQLAHMYLESAADKMIVVNKDLYERL